MVAATPGIIPNADPSRWQEHRFGLSAERWATLGHGAYWITGAGTGYGQALAIALAAAGAEAILTGRRREPLQHTRARATELGVAGDRFHVVPADVTDPAAIGAAATSILREARPLAGLVNCAALPQARHDPWPLLDGNRETWDRLMATNVTGAWLMSRAAVPLMISGARVRVLLLTSEAGWASTPGVGPYNVSKAALNGLGASLAAEVAARHPRLDIQINVLDPGEAGTEMNRGSTISPFAVVSMALALLSHPANGPNGRFFHRDGRHLSFAYAEPWPRPVLPPDGAAASPRGGVARQPRWLRRPLGRPSREL